ncbi:Carboxymuconolactone decarboxylase [Alkaliphilus metalliredigens QYMF]|uniref:Carboxymuconolactone decarboxylase n=1 Tax=Alkaliphilus metalliredigens (strain QYMF) TaxID=293826 RepID=A6TST0_ALKMQ|nr:carboxymuconolactone decarboxylase family protein [Alkaliphilus metalliredigens]ABR49248.1 Carboxymuconolactone decarboxylase [Alkaliphilus metalliredigens QYMF]
MDVMERNLHYFISKHKEIYEAYENYGSKLHEKGGPLDDKTRWLIKVAISASSQYEYALRTHIKKAIRFGCTREEIEHSIMLVAPSGGFPKMMEALLILRDELGDE